MRRIWGESLTLATANDQALLDEMHLRDKCTAELSVALEQKATYDQLLAMVARLESGRVAATK